MGALLGLIFLEFGVVLVDVDNAMYTAKRISGLNTRRRLAPLLSLA